MHQPNSLLVTLDLSPMDESLIRYAFSVADGLMDIERIVLIHVGKNLDKMVPHENGHITKKESIHKKIEDLLYKTVTREITEQVGIEVVAGEPLQEILRISREMDIDGILVGKKNISDGSGLLARRITRKALCTVLAVTEKLPVSPKKILVPLDFSKTSEIAMSRAMAYAQRTGSEILCLNVVSLPQGFYASGKSEEEFGAIMKQNCIKKYKQFIHKFESEDVKISSRFQFDPNNSVAKIINNIALVEDIDVIVIGSKGRTDLAATFLGSVTEKVLLHNMSIPTLVVKEKSKNLSLFGALMNI
ncbi:universal stress protein [Sediminitomix flava]|uniref:Nucleotide-binding universal stress UspA family protein n=1 Tax=Sediminitomix flava TaxID=379075 RepID=A0A315ZFV9_SEDFL|nr:universal stress protein [Sediminitomix flava]PWJ43738.1 nucleotide-binding universal stress UspA family protein [Sediminitomix flava]